MQLRSAIKFGLTPAACGRPPEPRGDVFECRQATTANGLTSGWRYYLGKNSTAYEVLDRQSGDKVIAAQARLNRAEDYAIISRILDVADFLTHDNYMQEAFRSAPPKWWKKNMPVVITHEVLLAPPDTFEAFGASWKTAQERYLAMKPACGYLSEAVAVPKKFDDIKAGYQRALSNGSSSPADELDVRWLADYLTLAHDDDWYLAETAGGFWVRRSIDGTEAQVFRLVKKLLATFEPQVLVTPTVGCSIRRNPRRARATKGNGRRFRATWIIPDPATRLES